MERRLAAILSADVVGYSRLMADDQEATVRTLTAYREQVGALVREHRGRMVDFSGDNFLAEFPTAIDAVESAIQIQRVLRARNADLPEDRKMQFRIGAHLGDVAVDGERIYGDGVNIAARLEGLAEPGGICISATVHEQVRNKLSVGYSDLGDQSVKNIPDQVHVYQVDLEGTYRACDFAVVLPPEFLHVAKLLSAREAMLRAGVDPESVSFVPGSLFGGGEPEFATAAGAREAGIDVPVARTDAAVLPGGIGPNCRLVVETRPRRRSERAFLGDRLVRSRSR